VVVAGGQGQRFGGPKQFAELAGRPLVAWAVEACRSVCEGVVLVVPAGSAEDPAVVGAGADRVAEAGPSRSASVRSGLAAVPEEAGWVVVHDAARPLATPALFERVLAEVRRPDGPAGCVPGLAVSDTLKELPEPLDAGASTGAVVTRTVPRERLVAVQTPQAFRAEALRAAHRGGGEATDDAGLLEALGLAVRCVPGEAANRKVTTKEDLALMAATLGGPVGGFRVGQGFDVHPFAEPSDGRRLVLGGVEVPGAPGLAGHSDADVVAHALADAVLGAAGLGDIGQHFPASEPAWAGADSMDLLARSVAMAKAAGWRVGNGHCTVVAERPALAGYLGAMGERLGGVLGAPVQVTAKRAEGLGSLGRREGMACFAVCLLLAEGPGGGLG
jgi:2-C-methyl-D-erythritol 4-phosphate cytidylyltransferase/2-C-methyl-D-erythritol 2,4-cyclodiphosphate synthase